MTQHAPLLAGLLVGLSIAAPVGPMSLLCIQRTLRSGMPAGLGTGLGAATVNVLHGGAILFGMGQLAPWLAGSERLLGCLGGLFLLWSAARALARGRIGPRHPAGPALSPLAAYGTAVAFNASNPMSLVLAVALLSPTTALAPPSLEAAASLLLGMFAAASSWWLCLCGAVALLRSRLSPAVLLWVNHAAALLLTLYGAAALARSAGL